MNEQEREIVSVQPNAVQVIQPNAGILAHYHALPQSEDASPVCTWALDTPEARYRLQRVISGASESLWDACAAGPIEFECDDLVAHYTEYESEERPGELRQGPMLTLCGPAGTYHTSSEFAFRALQKIAQIGDPPPWLPPMKLRAVRQQSRGKRSYLTILCMGRSVI